MTTTINESTDSRDYWTRIVLAGGPTPMPPWSRDARSGVGRGSQSLGAELTVRLRARSGELGVPFEALVLAAHARVLSDLSGETEVVTGWTGTEGGPSLPCRLATDVGSWQALIERATKVLEAIETHRHHDVAGLRTELGLTGPGFEAELDVSASAENPDRDRYGDEGGPVDGALWKLVMSDDGNEVHLECRHRTEVVDGEAAARILGYHQRALEFVADDPSVIHRECSLLSDEELAFQLDGLAGPRRELPDRRIHELFEAAVASHPEAVAAVCGDRHWTYGELNARANRIGRVLLDRGVETETVVAVVTERNLDWMAAVLAIFKAGGVYLPIEPQFPAERIARTLARAECRFIVTERDSSANLLAAVDSQDVGTTVLPVDEILAECNDDRNLDIGVDENQLAYIYFTSGSTGEPKGAMCEHAGMINHLYAKIDDFGIGPGEVVAQIAPQCFDISLWQLVSALLVDGTTLIVEQDTLLEPERFLDQVVGGRVSVLQVVPSYLEVLLSHLDQNPRDLGPLHCVSVTGEALSMELVERWFEAQSGIHLANAYGLTETSDDTNHEVMERPPDGDRVPLGRAVNNVSVRVVDPDLRPVPLGAPGEIVFAGICVGRGYINDPERTAEAFLEDNFEPGRRLYRSGDFGRWRPDGKLEFLGRRDAQIKIRGFRIEIGDIENALLGIPGIRHGAVVVVDRPDGDKQLVGFHTGQAVDEDVVRDGLISTLPRYMVPDVIHHRSELPLTDNGKVDRKALRALAVELDAAAEVQPPATPAEQRLAAVWATVLNVAEDQIGRHDNFFDRGSSLTAVEMVIALDGAVTLKQVTRNPVLADLAALLDDNSGDRGDNVAEPQGLLQPLSEAGEDSAGVLVCFPYAGGNAINFRALAAELRGSGLAVQAVELPGHQVTTSHEPFHSLTEVVSTVVEEIVALAPPRVFLWGHSSGAAFAIEATRALERLGLAVAGVFLAAQLPGRAETRRNELVRLGERSDSEIAERLLAAGGYTELADLDPERADRVGAAYRHDCAEAHRALLARLEGRGGNGLETGRADKLAAPVTVVLAADDPTTAHSPAPASDWELIADDVDLVTLDSGGHYFVRTRPAEVAAVLERAAVNSMTAATR